MLISYILIYGSFWSQWHGNRNGSNTKGYFVWSFFDLFEAIGGFTNGFGLYYVDLDDKEYTRYPKLSSHWYANFLKGDNMTAIIPNIMVNDSFSSSC